MERPVYLSENIWQFLIQSFHSIPETELPITLKGLGYDLPNPELSSEKLLEIISRKPSPFLLERGIMDRPQLLRNVVVGIEIQKNLSVEYIISERAAEALQNGDTFIILNRLGDNQELVISKDRLAQNFANHTVIDYIEDKPHKHN